MQTFVRIFLDRTDVLLYIIINKYEYMFGGYIMKFVLFLITSILIVTFMYSVVIAKDINQADGRKYIEVVVQQGDTLWNIVKPYYDGKSDFRNLVDDIRTENNLKDAIIYPGQIIKIPASF